MPLERKKTLNVFKEAKNVWGSYDDYPVGPKGTDPMPYLSRNRIPQPFFLVSDEDQVIIQMAGEGKIELKDVEPNVMHLSPGDTVYIPACVPSRLIPNGENVQLRLKPEPLPREAVAWYCGSCQALVHSRELGAGTRQDEYWQAAIEFNENASIRTCKCGHVEPPCDLGDIAWPAVAEAIRTDE